MVIAELLGIDESDREDFRGWSEHGDRVTGPPARRDHGGAGRALGFHRRAHPVQARPSRGGSGLAPRGQRGRGVPAEQGGAVHVPPHPVGGRQRDHPDALVRDGARAGRASGPAHRLGFRPLVGARGGGGMSALGHARSRLLPHRHRRRPGRRDPVSEGDYLCMLYASGNRDERVFGGTRASTCGVRPIRCISPSASASTCVSGQVWPAWRPGSSWRSSWGASPLTRSRDRPRGCCRPRSPGSGRCRWCWRREAPPARSPQHGLTKLPEQQLDGRGVRAQPHSPPLAL